MTKGRSKDKNYGVKELDLLEARSTAEKMCAEAHERAYRALAR